MVGRWPSGAPLVLSPERDDPALADPNDFMYAQSDAHGYACPIGAHIRRANPRDSLDPRPGSPESIAVNKRHRLLRRGRAYGPPLSVEQALSDRDAPVDERGLHFICLNGNIARQFEFVQHTWINNPKFDQLYDDADPILAGREHDALYCSGPARSGALLPAAALCSGQLAAPTFSTRHPRAALPGKP